MALRLNCLDLANETPNRQQMGNWGVSAGSLSLGEYMANTQAIPWGGGSAVRICTHLGYEIGLFPLLKVNLPILGRG
jgi:hypothetical protein